MLLNGAAVQAQMPAGPWGPPSLALMCCRYGAPQAGQSNPSSYSESSPGAERNSGWRSASFILPAPFAAMLVSRSHLLPLQSVDLGRDKRAGDNQFTDAISA